MRSASPQPTTPAAHWPASHSSRNGNAAPSAPAAAPTPPRPNWSATCSRAERRGALGEVAPSYKPAVQPADLAACLPGFAIEAIREALGKFARDIPGFAMHDAVLTGVETRTSSPIRISRNADGHSLNTRGLFPAGEGAGYAGGIMSAGVDGIRVAEAVAVQPDRDPAGGADDARGGGGGLWVGGYYDALGRSLLIRDTVDFSRRP